MGKRSYVSEPRANLSTVANLMPKRSEKEELARNLHAAMITKDMTQSDLARRTGTGKDSISYYMNGKNKPGPLNLKKLAEALGTTPDKLMPSALGDAMSRETPDIEMRSAPNGQTWLSIHKVVSLKTALAVLDLINNDGKK